MVDTTTANEHLILAEDALIHSDQNEGTWSAIIHIRKVKEQLRIAACLGNRQIDTVYVG